MKTVITIAACFSCSILTAQDSLLQKKSQADSVSVISLEEVTVSASRLPERIMQSPVSVGKATGKYFTAAAAPSFFDALENIKGVHMITPSLGFRILNTRGFANTTNVRFVQMADGMDMQSPHIGSPIGSSLGPGDLDVETVEILPGIASALYGMNTVNGFANINTRNPFSSPGFSFQQKTGLMHLGDKETKVRVFSETSFRWAQVISPRIAYKINGSFVRGYDWIGNNYIDLNPAANASTSLTGADNPATDPVNSYGNESSNRRTINLQGKNYIVARSGYFEKDVVDYSLQNIKSDAALYYKFAPGTTLSYIFHFAYLNTVYQRSNRFRLQEYFLQQHGLQFESRSVQVKVYFNNENTGKSYNLRSMAENIDRHYKPDNNWFNDYEAGFNTAYQNGAGIVAAHQQARRLADDGRYVPGSTLFNETLAKLQNINNWDSGAALRVKASFVQLESQWNLSETLNTIKKKMKLDLLVGIDHRTYIVVPDGNYFINPVKGKEFSKIYYNKTGGFISVSKKLLNDKLKLGAILRADKNDYFRVLFNPRLTAVFSPSLQQNFRAAYQTGYRYPILFEAYSNVNSGGVKRVGGLPVMSNGIFENAWLQSSITAFQAAVVKDINNSGLTKNAAIEKNKALLKKNAYGYIKPEHVNSFELGYRGIFAKGRLFTEADFYFNHFRSFIAQANMNVPVTGIADSIPYNLYEKSKQSPYRMWTNSQTVIYNFGFSFGLSWHLQKNYLLSGNASFAKLRKAKNEDGLEDGFNTPKWITNLSLSNDRIAKNLGFGITFKWQSRYYWQSFLINGNVPAITTVDAQVSYFFPMISIKIKAGASNLLNQYYYSILGGPQIGGMYYINFMYGIK